MVQSCLVCGRKKFSKSKDFKLLHKEYITTSGKTIRAVLEDILKCTQINLEITPTSVLCSNCYKFLLSYDEHVSRLMSLQNQFKLIYENSTKRAQAPPPDRTIDLKSLDEETETIELKSEPNSDGGNEFLVKEENHDLLNLDIDNLSDNDACRRLSEITENTTESVRTKVKSDRKFQPQQNPEHKCAYCKRTFSYLGRLRKHVLQIHTKKKHSCKVCGVSYKNEEYLELHMNIHEGKTEYDCRYCDKRFKKRSNVVRHMAKHWDKKNKQCEKCGLQFSDIPALYHHKLSHRAEENPLICSVCNLKCKTIQTYKRHIKTHREDRPRYPCTVCGKTFSERFTLKSHLRTHPESIEPGTTSREKPTGTFPPKIGQDTSNDTENVCIICGSVFNTKIEHNKHMKSKHDVISWDV